MTFAAVHGHLRRIPWIRQITLQFWKWGRDLPRRVRFQKIPALQRWSGRPVGWHRTAGEYLARHPGRGWEKLIRPGGTYERLRPLPLGPALPPCFDPPQTVAWEDERVLYLEGGRYWGGYGGSIVTHDEHLLGELSPDIWGLERHTLFNKFKLPAVAPLPGLTAVLSTAEADLNYSHWMMDLLPRLDLLARAGYGPDKVDRYFINFGGAPYEAETLAFAGLPREKLQAVDAGTHYRCEALVTTSIRPAHWQYSLPGWVAGHLRDLIGPVALPPATRRLYLTRRNASFRRVLNEEALLGPLQERGFEIFDPGTASVRAQAATFAQAAMIVSPHSSALTNLVFCQPGTPVLELHPADYFDVSFWTAATAARIRYHAVVGQRVGPVLRTAIEGRRQDLTIPAATFGAQLDALLASARL